ncbi:MAG: alpha/beta hydrolase [Anaerolineales bacterium]
MPDPTSSPTPTPTSTPFLCPNLRGRTIQHYLVSDAMREEVRYLVHLPPCYDYYQDKAFPVLYLLHGWPMDEGHWDALGMDELADDWISREIVGPFIIVMPGVSSDGLYVHSSGGPGSFEGMFISELLPAVDQAYRTWQAPEGRAIGGISRGGVWALEIALRHAELFGTVGAHSPALALNRPLPQYDPFVLVQEGPPDLRFYLNAGDADWARAGTIRLRDVLLEKEADVVYQVHEGSHVDALWRRALLDNLSFYTATWPPAFESLPAWHGD